LILDLSSVLTDLQRIEQGFNSALLVLMSYGIRLSSQSVSLTLTRASPADESDGPGAVNSVGMRAVFSLQEKPTNVLLSVLSEGWGEWLILVLFLRVMISVFVIPRYTDIRDSCFFQNVLTACIYLGDEIFTNDIPFRVDRLCGLVVRVSGYR
jgi:hypothetical protein